jgi:hypothetical protein
MAARVAVAAGVRASTRTASGRVMSLRRPTLRAVLVAVEAAVAALLVVGAGLLWDSFRHMQRADLGVDADHVLTFWVIPSERVCRRQTHRPSSVASSTRSLACLASRACPSTAEPHWPDRRAARCTSLVTDAGTRASAARVASLCRARSFPDARHSDRSRPRVHRG